MHFDLFAFGKEEEEGVCVCTWPMNPTEVRKRQQSNATHKRRIEKAKKFVRYTERGLPSQIVAAA